MDFTDDAGDVTGIESIGVVAAIGVADIVTFGITDGTIYPNLLGIVGISAGP